MRQRFCIFAIASFACYAQVGQFQVYGVGNVNATTGSGNVNLNGASNWASYGFQVPAKTLVKVRVMLNQVTGVLGSSDLRCEIQPETNLIPSGSALATSSTLTSPAATGAWIEFTGYSLALSAYTPYRIVLKNLNGSPMTNYPTYRTFLGFGSGMISGPASAVQTTSNGSTWSQIASNSTPIYRLEFSDGSFQGYPVEFATPVSSGIAANHRIRSTVASGVTFTTPAGLSWSVYGCAVPVGKIGAPTGALSCYIDSDDGSTITNVAQSTNSYVAAGVDTTARNTAFYFSSPVKLNPSTKYRVYLIESTQADSTSHYFGATLWTMSNDVNSLGLLPMQGTWRGTYCPASCSTRTSWVDDPVNLPSLWVLLNPAGEATSTGGGGTRVYSH